MDLAEAEKQIYATGPRIGKRKSVPRPAIAGNHIDPKSAKT